MTIFSKIGENVDFPKQVRKGELNAQQIAALMKKLGNRGKKKGPEF